MADYEYRDSKELGAEDNTLDETSVAEVSLSPKTTKDEVHEWMLINRGFRRHGFSAMRILPSTEVPIQSGRYVCLDLESSESLRNTVTFLMNSNNRHDSIMQDLVYANEQLRAKVQQLTDEAEEAKSKAKDIKVMLECSRSRVQELEEECTRSSSQFADDGERLRNTKSVISSKCRQLEAQVKEQEKEIDRLKRELVTFGLEDERRSKRQSQAFSNFKKRSSRPSSATDQTLLDVIDSYESQIHQLKQQLRNSSGDLYQGEDISSEHHPPPGHYKDIIKSFEKQLRMKDKKLKALETERDTAHFESGSKPEVTDYRVLAQKVKQMERILRLHNISIPGEKPSKDPYANRKKFSVRLEDLDYLPLEEAHRYLRDLCKELETDNLDCLCVIMQEMKDDSQNGDRFKQYCRHLAEVVQSVDEFNHRNRTRNYERDTGTLLCDANMRHFLEVVDNWRKDICGLDHLQASINTLLEKCVPWLRAHMEGEHSVSEMVETLERVIHAEKNQKVPIVMEEVSRSTLDGIVNHFQTLFDVKKVSGIYPRMNQIYKTLGEAQNVQTTLKNILGLSEDANSSMLVDTVGKLCHTHNSTTAKQLKKLLQTNDLDGIIRRLDEHNEFFPVFQGIMCKLFDILGIDKMDEVLPAVRALKLLAR